MKICLVQDFCTGGANKNNKNIFNAFMAIDPHDATDGIKI